MSKISILSRWGITENELTDLVDQNPSLRGILLGYVAEHEFHKRFLETREISEATKDDDHDRALKGDRRITYKEHRFIIEVKSLQSNLVKRVGPDEWVGKAQVDASDRRTVGFPNGSKLETTCLRRGEFDILAVNCFAFGDSWRFAFGLNDELPPNSYKKYTAYQREHLLPTLITIHWPLRLPFVDNPFALLDRLVSAGRGR